MRAAPAVAFILVIFLAGHAERASAGTETVNPRFSGTPFHQVWTNEDYGAAQNNWAVRPHPTSHFIYVGNNAGILKYDGVTWRMHPMPDGGPVRALAIDRRGRIWASTVHFVWRLELNPATGEWQGVSMMHRLPAEERSTRGLYSVEATAAGVFFSNQEKLYFFPENDPELASVFAWPSVVQPGIWWMDNAVHGALLDGTIVRLRDGRFEPLGRANPGLRPFAALPRREDGSRTFLTMAGLMQWAPSARRPLPLGPNELKLSPANPAQDALVLADGRIAFATARHGVVIFDDAGRIVQRLNRESGLPANDVEAIAEDVEGGLWLIQRGRIVRVQLDSPFALHGPAQNLPGGPTVMRSWKDRLYVGHTEGLAWRDFAGRFHPVANVTGTRMLFVHDDHLYAAGRQTLVVPPDDGGIVLNTRNTFGLLSLRGKPEFIATIAPRGLFLDRVVNGVWQLEGIVADVSGLSGCFAQTSDGFLWCWAYNAGMQRIDFRSGPALNPLLKKYGPAEGIPAPANASTWPKIFILGDTVGLWIDRQLLRYDAKWDRFVPEDRIEGFPGGEGIQELYPQQDGSLWIRRDTRRLHLARVRPEGGGAFSIEPFAHPSLGEFDLNVVFEDSSSQTVWLGGSRTLLSLDRDWRPLRPLPPLQAFVRRLETLEGRALPVAQSTLALPATAKALRMTFGAPTFVPEYNGRSRVEFRSRLEGLETEWTPWSVNPRREFTNLLYRGYRLHVQARSADGRVSPDTAEGLLAFRIASPWWLTRWAFAGYGVMALLGVTGMIALRTRVLHRRAAVLEQQVADRTLQLQERNRELARLHQLELDEKIAARLAEEKTQLELLRYQLNPHFLYNALNSIYGQIFSKPGAAAETVVRIADFCRATLSRRSDALQTVEEELKMISSYLTVEKARWGDEILIDVDSSDAARARTLPSFVLLPLVENAIKYGAVTNPGVLRVRVTARVGVDDTLELEVANTGVWVEPGTAKDTLPGIASTGIGYENLRQRLQRFYPGRHTLTHETRDGWVTVRLSLTSLHVRPASPRPTSLAH